MKDFILKYLGFVISLFLLILFIFILAGLKIDIIYLNEQLAQVAAQQREDRVLLGEYQKLCIRLLAQKRITIEELATVLPSAEIIRIKSKSQSGESIGSQP